MKKITIITATFNSSNFLSQCLESVKNQKMNRDYFEHIFVDWYSSDKTIEMINNYKTETKYDIRIIQKQPKWVYNAVNEWAKNSNWEYLLFLNSDDWLEPNILNSYIQFIEWTGKKDLYYWGVMFHNKNKRFASNWYMLIKKILFKISWLHILILYPWVIMKKQTFIDLWMFDETKKIASDYWMWLNILKNNKSYVYFPKIVANFRIHEKGISSNKDNKIKSKEECLYFQKKYLSKFQQILLKILESLISVISS